jgi:hypothetical protein
LGRLQARQPKEAENGLILSGTREDSSKKSLLETAGLVVYLVHLPHAMALKPVFSVGERVEHFDIMHKARGGQDMLARIDFT